MIDFSQEDEQRDGNYGPVPVGSIVVVKMEVLEPFAGRQAANNHLISVAKSGLHQLYCQFTVDKGQFTGVEWRQNITLPMAAQVISLTDKQAKACRIGGATLKAILQASGRPTLQIASYADFNGMKFPVRVKLNPQPYESQSGQLYWRNEIGKVITPDMPEYNEVRYKGEIITDGPVSGEAKPSTSNGGYGYAPPSEQNMDMDSLPF